jgi:hypothetical protein
MVKMVTLSYIYFNTLKTKKDPLSKPEEIPKQEVNFGPKHFLLNGKSNCQ